MSPEAWRTIPGHPLYEVSDLGKVRSWCAHGPGFENRREQPKPLKAHVGDKGYPMVTLSGRDRRTPGAVHLYVALAFLGPCPEGHEVCHNDGNKLNPVLANLRYGTRRENVLDQLKHGQHYQAAKTHCKRGHEFTASNTRTETSGARRCLTCQGQYVARRRRARQSARAAA